MEAAVAAHWSNPMNRTRILVLAGLAAITVPLAAWAGGGFGGGGHCRMHGGEVTAEEARDHVGRMADRALDRVDATDDQRARVDTILDQNVPKLHAIKEDGRDLREEGRALLSADQVDAASVEAIRAEAITLADEGSRVVADTLVQVANVLTKEQRLELAAVLERFHDEGGRHGGHGEKARGERAR